MQVQHKLNDKTTIIADGKTQEEVFENLASMSEIFGQNKCGKCGSYNVAFVMRNVEDGKKEFKYPEMQCQAFIDEKGKAIPTGEFKAGAKPCGAKLSFGHKDGGTLYPKRYQLDEDHKPIMKDGKKVSRGTNGWVRYDKTTGIES